MLGKVILDFVRYDVSSVGINTVLFHANPGELCVCARRDKEAGGEGAAVVFPLPKDGVEQDSVFVKRRSTSLSESSVRSTG